MTPQHDWEQHLRWLLDGAGRDLDGGAELELTDPDGTVRRWPLARHHRIEESEDGTAVLWIRPVVGGWRDPAGRPYFSLCECKRCGIAWEHVDRAGDAIVFELASGQRLRIQPAGPERLPTIDLWDALFLTQLDADEQTALEELAEDSWAGRFA